MAGGTIRLLPKRVNTESLFFIFFCQRRQFAAISLFFRHDWPIPGQSRRHKGEILSRDVDRILHLRRKPQVASIERSARNLLTSHIFSKPTALPSLRIRRRTRRLGKRNAAMIPASMLPTAVAD